MSRSRLSQLQVLLLGAGLVLIGYVSSAYLGSAWVRAGFERQLLSSLNRHAPKVWAPPPEQGELIGRLRIDRIGLSAIVLEGVDGKTLGLAAGHVPTTALPGNPGRVTLAGHRDQIFRRLRDVRPGDHIVLETQRGDFHYDVDSLRIVAPTDVAVLASGSKRELQLLTCYPFGFLGRAPQRFVALASQIEP